MGTALHCQLMTICLPINPTINSGITLVCRIDMQNVINVQVGKFLKNIKHAGQNRRAGVFFFKINKRADQNKTMQGGIFSQNHPQSKQ